MLSLDIPTEQWTCLKRVICLPLSTMVIITVCFFIFFQKELNHTTYSITASILCLCVCPGQCLQSHGSTTFTYSQSKTKVFIPQYLFCDFELIPSQISFKNFTYCFIHCRQGEKGRERVRERKLHFHLLVYSLTADCK